MAPSGNELDIGVKKTRREAGLRCEAPINGAAQPTTLLP
jgi:hypothetical protein